MLEEALGPTISVRPYSVKVPWVQESLAAAETGSCIGGQTKAV